MSASQSGPVPLASGTGPAVCPPPEIVGLRASVLSPTYAGSQSGICPLLPQVLARLDELTDLVHRLQAKLHKPNVEEPDTLCVQHAAELLSRAPFTVRQWCRTGRIKAHRARSGRGPYAEWRIPMDSIRSYQKDGLLDPSNRYA